MGEGAKQYLFQDMKIKRESIFDFGELYQRLFSWFEVMGYDFYEKSYEKFDLGGATNLKIFWEATKEVDGYTQFVIEPSFFIIGLSNVEIEKDGLKIKTNKCTMEMRISAYLIKDVDNKMQKSMGNLGRNIYEKYVAKDRLDDHELRLYEEAHLFMDEIKSFVSMHKF